MFIVQCRGVYTIVSLEQMLQKISVGGRFDVELGWGNVFVKKYYSTITEYKCGTCQNYFFDIAIVV